MKLKKPISYSAYEKYHQCPRKYDLHYNHRIRPDFTPNQLLFGSATDKAINEILLGKSEEDAIEAAKIELGRLFKEKVILDHSDYDDELITEETRKLLVSKLDENEFPNKYPKAIWETLWNKVEFGITLNEAEIKAQRILVFFSWLEKIALIIQAWRDYVEPQIEEIVSVQREVKRGKLDFELRLKGFDGIIVADNKTASRDYEENAVRTSVQLAGYGAETGAYIVFNKTVRKNRTKICSECGNNGTGKRHKTCDQIIDEVRCDGAWEETITPEIIPQIIIDKISKQTRDIVEDSFQKTEQLIETGVFPCNLKSCGNQFGRPCEYYNYCWNNKDMKGLKHESKTGPSDNRTVEGICPGKKRED